MSTTNNNNNFSASLELYPLHLDFFHQLGNAANPPIQLLEATLDDAGCTTSVNYEVEIAYISGNNWVTYVQTNAHLGGATYNIGVDPSIFTAGTYHAKIRIKAYCNNGTPDLIAVSDWTDIFLQIIDGNYIDVTPGNISFTHILGSALPASIPVNIRSNTDWTAEVINTSNVSISVTSGTGDAVIDIALTSDIDSESAGTYNYYVRITSVAGIHNISVNVDLTASSGFSLSPAQITHNYNRGTAVAPSFTINLFADDDWTANVPTDLSLSASSGNSSQVLEMHFANITRYAPGTYIYNIDFSYQGSTYQLPVTLVVYDFLNTSLAFGKIAFTHNRDFLQFTSTNNNSYIDLHFGINVQTWQGNMMHFDKHYKLPLFNKEGILHPGSIIHQFFDTLKKQPDMTGEFIHLYKPVRVDIEITERDFDNDNQLFATEITGLLFDKGSYYPTDKLMLLLENKVNVRMPSDNRIYIPFFTFGNVMLSMDFADTMYLYSTQANINEPANVLFNHSVTPGILYPGDTGSVNISVCDTINCASNIATANIIASDAVQFLVFPKQKNAYYIMFQNQYGVLQRFEFTGKMQRNSVVDRKINKLSAYYFSREETAKVDVIETITINTGWVLPDEIATVQALVNTHFAWLETADGYLEIIPQKKKITLTGDYDKLHNFDIEFKIIANTNDKIYL